MMKYIIHGGFLFSFLVLCSCQSHQRSLNSTDVSKSTVTPSEHKQYDSTYHEQDIHAAYFSVNDTAQISYFETSIDDIQCALYLNSSLTQIDSVATPTDSANLVAELKTKDAVLRINGKWIGLEKPIKDGTIMLPTFIGHTKKNGLDYVLIRMNLVSSMGGDFWYNLLIKLKNSVVVKQTGIETTGELTPAELKKYIN
ncbi:hypothetical protein ACE38W_09960 [Chitinophaga sp. Hz27]|uniref:hypothetical protein n=1 Tax=Chitinophaga sp. Hz27 TaxID=3347169 RepID=UPI0035DF557D